MSLINNETIDIINKNNIKFVTCEIGTAGIISNILSVKGSEHCYLGSIVINNHSMLNNIVDTKRINFVGSSLNNICQDVMHKMNADLCLTTYIDKDNLYISLIFYDKIYNKECKLKENPDQKQQAAILALSYLSTFIENNNKK